MLNLCGGNLDRCVPFRITNTEADSKGLIGGQPPIGVEPRQNLCKVNYFATLILSIEPMNFVSIFVAELDELLKKRGSLNELGLIDVVVHSSIQRGLGSKYCSPLSEHYLSLLDEAVDWIEDDTGEKIIRAGHKIGGRPYFIQHSTKLIKDIKIIQKKGFLQIAQFDFPDADDAEVDGNWPFADGLFNLFGKYPYKEHDWKWTWDA